MISIFDARQTSFCYSLFMKTNTLNILFKKETALLLSSFFIVAFGQPAWSPLLGLLASCFGYGLFWRVAIEISSPKWRFWSAFSWFFATELVQTSWMLTHPYNYIFFVYFGFAFFWAAQFGALALFVTKANIQKNINLIGLASLWTLMEWSRLFFLSGYTWNPIGIGLTGSLYTLQLASVAGIFGLSFWVMLTNLFGLKAWMPPSKTLPTAVWLGAAAFPYFFGMIHFHIHEQNANLEGNEPINAVLVQTAFPAEEALPFKDFQSYVAFVGKEWEQILNISKKHLGKTIDLMVLPEYVVPFGTYSFIYPYESVKKSFINVFGDESLKWLPPKEEPFARQYQQLESELWLVNNAFWAQAIANAFQTELVMGLEDADELEDGTRAYYSSAIYFKPGKTAEEFSPTRYAKRVLLPLAEYIPFSFCKDFAAQYGIQSSFTPGEEATVLQGCKAPFGLSICYEETFGDLMRESRQNGSELLVNLTSDVWYPNSKLPKQHFDHARLRTVENGIPLLRACNTGITCGVDSLGRIVSTLHKEDGSSEWLADSLYVSIPRYHYKTLYSSFGDKLIIGFCLAVMLLLICKKTLTKT